MSLTINVNGLTLCHKGSNGISRSTLPDVCKTPPVATPIPYPNVAFSKNLTQGTHSVFADGGNMIAHNRSNFATSIMDEPGTLGGVVSGVNRSKAEWISYSFDVFFERKPACRLTDKMFMNKKNTVNLAGLMQAPLENWPELMIICTIICHCDKNPKIGKAGQKLKQSCVNETLNALKSGAKTAQDLGVPEELMQYMDTIHPEISYDMTKKPPSPLLNRESLKQGEIKPSSHLITRMIQEGLKSAKNNGGIYQVRRPDVSLMKPMTKSDIMKIPEGEREKVLQSNGNLKGVVEIKFDEPRKEDQIEDYKKITGRKDNVTELSPETCKCDNEDSHERVYELSKEYERANESLWDKTKRTVGEAYDYIGTVTGLTGAALFTYFIISESSRLFPPRNLVPVP